MFKFVINFKPLELILLDCGAYLSYLRIRWKASTNALNALTIDSIFNCINGELLLRVDAKISVFDCGCELL